MVTFDMISLFPARNSGSLELGYCALTPWRWDTLACRDQTLVVRDQILQVALSPNIPSHPRL